MPRREKVVALKEELVLVVKVVVKVKVIMVMVMVMVILKVVLVQMRGKEKVQARVGELPLHLHLPLHRVPRRRSGERRQTATATLRTSGVSGSVRGTIIMIVFCQHSV